jgi:hypothetical protein
MHLGVRVSSQDSEWSCICVRVSSQDSEWSCICVRVSSQDREWSCICVLGYEARKVSGHALVC